MILILVLFLTIWNAHPLCVKFFHPHLSKIRFQWNCNLGKYHRMCFRDSGIFFDWLHESFIQNISPIEALGYRPTHKTVKERKAGKGKVIARLSLEQFTKDKKRTAVVLLSLAASLSVYLCVVTMLDSQVARTIVSNYMDTDMVIKNDTACK